MISWKARIAGGKNGKEVTEPSEKEPGAVDPQDIAKQRRCLRCRTHFESAWYGQRICQRCKNTTAWRSGLPKHGTGTHEP